MVDVSRRVFVQKVSMGAAAVGALAATAPLLAGSRPAQAAPALADPVPPAGPVIAHVRDLATGAVDVYVGTRQVSVRDRELARALTRAASA